MKWLTAFLFLCFGVIPSAYPVILFRTGDALSNTTSPSYDRWKLAGIHYAITGQYNFSDDNNTEFNAAIFDEGGLYVGSDSSGYTLRCRTTPPPINRELFSRREFPVTTSGS